MGRKAEELLIGAHTSAAGGVANALLEGQEIGATTVQLFTANQKRWQGKPIDEEALAAWEEAQESTGIRETMSHDSYLINLGSPAEESLEKSRRAFHDEIERCIQLGVTYLNFHPGAALTSNPEACLNRIAESLILMEKVVSKGKTRLLLETTAGQGSSVGWRFEHLGHIIDKVKGRIPIGVCIDTCHIFAAGYDIRTREAWNQTLHTFDKEVGLKYLYAFHLNDSVKGLGSRVDRHAPLGEGMIGMECFAFLVQDPRTRQLPKYLETPDGPPVWKKEITKLRALASQK